MKFSHLRATPHNVWNCIFFTNDIDTRTCQRPNNQPKLGRLRELNWYLKHIDCPNAKIFKYGKIERDFFFCSRQFFYVWVTCAQSGKKTDDVTNLIFKSRDVRAKRLHMKTGTGFARSVYIGEREKENCCSGLGKASGNPIQWVLRREGSLKQPPARYS